MSASDRTSLRGIRARGSVFEGKTAGNSTARRGVNAVVRAVSLDSLGAAEPDDWFGVPIAHQPVCWTCASVRGELPAPPTVGHAMHGHARAYEKARRYFVPRAEACRARLACRL